MIFDDDTKGLSEDSLKRLSVLAEEQVGLEDEVAELSRKLKETQARLDEVSGVEIPDLLADTGLSELRLADGTKVAVKEDLKVGGTTGKYRDAINDWAERSGHGDVIKHEIKAQLNAGEDEKAAAVLAALEKDYGIKANDQKAVNPQTLKALIRELQEAGEDVPLDELGVFVFRRTKLERPR